MSTATGSINEPACCPPKSQIEHRPLLSMEYAAQLETLFKLLSSQTRLRMLHALVRNGELCVGEIAAEVDMKPQAVSNQLQRLSDRGIIAARRQSIQIYYRIVDPCVVQLLDRGICLLEDAEARVGVKVEN